MSERKKKTYFLKQKANLNNEVLDKLTRAHIKKKKTSSIRGKKKTNK